MTDMVGANQRKEITDNADACLARLAKVRQLVPPAVKSELLLMEVALHLIRTTAEADTFSLPLWGTQP